MKILQKIDSLADHPGFIYFIGGMIIGIILGISYIFMCLSSL